MAALLAFLPMSVSAVDGRSDSGFLDRFQDSSSGEEVREKILDAMKEAREALRQKKESGAIDGDERELLEHLGDAEASVRGIDSAELEGFAKLASGKSIEIVPDKEDEAAGMKPIAITPADIARAQEDAIRLSAAADAFEKSPEGRALAAVAAMSTNAVRGSNEAGWRAASHAGGGGRAGGSHESLMDGVGEVTAVAATSAQFPSVMNGFSEDGLLSTNLLDAVPFELLHFDYGGFHPPTNCHRSAVELSGLKVKRDGLSFKYVEDLSHWGMAHTDYSGALACLFVCDKDGRWVGGKFDWISSSRTTRDFENIYGGYNGWSLRNVPNPCPVAFVIVSVNGKRRSNVISGIWNR